MTTTKPRDCYDCPDCRGSSCSEWHPRIVTVCDKCGEEIEPGDGWEFDGGDYCEDCIMEVLQLTGTITRK